MQCREQIVFKVIDEVTRCHSQSGVLFSTDAFLVTELIGGCREVET